MFTELTTLAASAHQFWDASQTTPGSFLHSVIVGGIGFAAVSSNVLANAADIAIFLVCCAACVLIRRRCVALACSQSSDNPKSKPSGNRAVLWGQVTILLFGLSHIAKTSIFPDSFQLLSIVIQLIAVCSAVLSFTQFKRLTDMQPWSLAASSSPAGTALMRKTGQLEVNQRRLDIAEGNLQFVLEAGQVGLWEWDAEASTFLISSSFRKLLNLRSDAVWETMDDWLEHVALEARDVARQDFEEFAAGRLPGYEATYRMLTVDGQTTWIQCRAESIRDEAGEIVGARGIARDVSQQRKLGEQLARLEQAMAMSQEAVLFLQSNGRILRANNAATTMLHRSKDQLNNLTIFDIDQHQTPENWNNHWSSLGSADPFRGAATFVLPDGRLVNCDVQQSIVPTEDDQVLVLTAVDISARLRREGERRRHEFATDRATEAVYWARENGRLFYVNQALCRQMEYTKDELLNLRVSDLSPQLTADVWAKQWIQVKQDQFLTTETVHRSRSGRVTQVCTNLYFYEVESEQFLVATARDITAEKQAAAALAAKSAELEQLLRSLPLGMVFVNCDRKIIRVNSEFCRMFGYTAGEIEGQSAQLLYANEEEFEQAGNYHAILQEGPEPRRFMVKYQRKDGDMLRGETVGVVLRDSDGEVRGYLGLIKDYTEQWEAERALRRTQSALDASADAVLWVQQDGRITYANEVACQRLQYSKDELEQLTVADINTDLKSAEHFTTTFWPSIKEKGQIVVELHHRRRDGTVFPVEIVSNFQTFEGNEFTCSFIRDISERVKSQQQLVEAQAKLELAVQSGHVSLWEWDWETGEVQISDEYCRSLGENPGAVSTANDWRQRLHPDDAREELLVIHKLKQSAEVEYDRTYRVRHRDGSYRWLLSRGRLYRRPNGRPHRLVGSHVDITGLRQAQLRTEAYLKLIGTTDGSWDWDVERDAVIYSPRFFDLLGFSGGKFGEIPRSISFLKQQMHSEDRALFWQKIDEHFCTRDFFDHEVRLQMKQGKFRWFRFRAQTIFDSDNRPIRMAGSIYDVTQQKEAELQLRRSNNDLEQFAYVASHDLKEPLRAISGFCSLLKLKYDDQLDDIGRDYIRHAVDGTVRMQRLIEDLLNYARTGRNDEPKQIVGLRTCIDEAISDLQSTILDAKAEIVAKDLPDLECYPGLISRLFQNLIGNAIKFARDDVPARIKITAEHVNDGPHKHIQVSIADNGIGVEPKHQEQIFHLFKRLHYSDKIPGTGLGLAICHRIVERHRGQIRVVSNDQGSTFIVTLPVKVKE